ncbi:hypothetical protein HAX54_029458, partial [Datura stramonium]|nr:hypothetical protein [Datura stramonium]
MEVNTTVPDLGVRLTAFHRLEKEREEKNGEETEGSNVTGWSGGVCSVKGKGEIWLVCGGRTWRKTMRGREKRRCDCGLAGGSQWFLGAALWSRGGMM